MLVYTSLVKLLLDKVLALLPRQHNLEAVKTSCLYAHFDFSHVRTRRFYVEG
jgi:hypothetical protein